MEYMLQHEKRDGYSSVRLHKSTISLIDSLGKRGETYEEIILRLLAPLQKKGGSQ